MSLKGFRTRVGGASPMLPELGDDPKEEEIQKAKFLGVRDQVRSLWLILSFRYDWELASPVTGSVTVTVRKCIMTGASFTLTP